MRGNATLARTVARGMQTNFDMKVTKAKLRWLGIRALIAIPASWVAYLLVVNLLLWTGLAKSIINRIDPAHVSFDYDSAYSVWFARVHTKGFVVTGTDSAVQWRITTDEASTTFGVTDFFARRVHMFGAEAKGVTVRIRFKVVAPTPQYLAALPPIEGFPDPPLKTVEPPPLSDADYNLWTVALDDVVAQDVREVWVDTVHFTDEGGGRVQGAFYLKPMRSVFVDPTQYQVALGAVRVGATPVATGIHGDFDLRIAQFDPRAPTGNEAFKFVDANAVAVATLTDLAWLDSIAGPELAFTGGGGPLEISAQLRSGVIQPGSRFGLSSNDWAAWRGRAWASGSSLVRAHVADDHHVGADVAVVSSQVDLHYDRSSLVSAPMIALDLLMANTDLAAPLHPWTAHVDVPAAGVSDLKSLDGPMGDSAFLYGGSAHFSVHADADPRGGSGTFDATVSQLSMQAGKAVVTGNGSVGLTVKRFDAESGKADFSRAIVDVRDVSTGTQKGYWLTANASPCTLTLARGPAFKANIAGKARDAKLPLALVDAPPIVSSLVGQQGITFTSGVVLTPTTTEIVDLRLLGDSLDVRGHYRTRTPGKSGTNGAALLTTSLFNVGVALNDGAVSVRPLATRSWYDETQKQ